MTIADICCEFQGLEGEPLGDAVAMRYSAFLSDDAPCITAKVRVRSPIMGALPKADEPVITIEETSENRFEILRLDNPFEATLDVGHGRAEAVVNDNLYCFDSFLRIIYSILLADGDGLLLHSAAVASSDQAVLLVGVSEAGKTTLCSLGFPTVLSDELVAVRRSGSDFVAYSTPFWGEFVAGRVLERRPVGGIYLLRKGPQHEVRPAQLSSALFEILGCVFFFGPKRLTSAVLDRAGDLVEANLRGEFYFKPTADVVAFLDKEVEQYVA